MATATYDKIEAFIWKYYQMTSFGVYGNINFSSVKGNVFGNIIPPNPTPKSSPFSSKRSHQKPSRIKRRHQHTEAHLCADELIADVSTSPTT